MSSMFRIAASKLCRPLAQVLDLVRPQRVLVLRIAHPAANAHILRRLQGISVEPAIWLSFGRRRLITWSALTPRSSSGFS